MKRSLIAFALLAFAAAPGRAQDPAKVAAGQCKVAFENDYVRVLHWTIGPHEKVPMHDHPALVSVPLSAGKARYTSPNGESRDVESEAGKATWSDPVTHSSTNLSDKPGEIIQVELKNRPGAAMTDIPASTDPVKVDPKHYRVGFQNDRVRVLQIKYGPHEQSLMHGHPASVAVFLTEGETRFSFADGKTSTSKVEAGQVRWLEKEMHLPENDGSKAFEVVVVELR